MNPALPNGRVKILKGRAGDKKGRAG